MGKTDQSEIQEPIKKPRRRWRRRLVWAVFLVPILLLGCVLIIGQTSVMGLIVNPILSAQLGVDVSTGSVHLMPTGEIILNDAVCSTDSIDTKAGSLIEIDHAVISMNWWGVLKGGGQVRSIVIDKPIVRVSQDIDTGVLNLSAFTLKQSSGGGATPAITIRNGILQIGEHDKNHYRVLKELSIKGQISEQTASGVSGFEFEALPIEPGVSGSRTTTPGTFALTGQLSSDGIDGVLDGVRLEDWPAKIVPSRSRGIYERLALAGDLAPTRFHVTNDGLAEVILTLEGVGLNLPIEETNTDDGSASNEPLRMKQTRGVIKFGSSGLRGDLRGVIGNLEYTVTLDYRGLDADSPFDSELVTDFHLDDGFKPAKFLPTNVITKLDKFDHPKGDIHAVVRISRGDDPNDRSIQVSGSAEITNGSAIYKKFRYPFHDLHGMITFDSDHLEIHDIRGIGPTGASLVSNGVFSPLGKASIATLEFQADGVPMDDELMKALNPKQRQLVSTLFNEQKYGTLLDDGLILSPEDAEELAQRRRSVWDLLDALKSKNRNGTPSPEEQALGQELASLDRQLQTPLFAFEGVVNVHVQLIRHPDRPLVDRWERVVNVQIPSAGIVPKHFPVPIIAKDIHILITKKRVELAGGTYNGLAGGNAEVDLAIDMTQEKIKPVINIKVRDFPIDQRLIAAIPGYDAPQSDDPDDLSLRRVLDRLRLSGVMECDAVFGPRSDGAMGYDVDATVMKGSARPVRLTGVDSPPPSRADPGAAALRGDPLAIDGLIGTIYVTEKLIIVDLDGMLSSPGQPLAPTPMSVLTQLTMPRDRVGASERGSQAHPMQMGPPEPGPRLYATAHADRVDLSMPLEHAIAVLSPRLARELLKKNAIYHTEGVLGFDAKLEGIVGGAIETTLTLNQIEHFGFDDHQTRYQIGSSYGRAQVVLSSQPSVGFEGFRIPIRANDEDAGVLMLDGSLPLARAGRYIEITKPSALEIAYDHGTFDSPITRGVIERFSSDRSDGWLATHQIGGRFDLGVTLAPKLGMHKGSESGPSITLVPTMINGSLLPKSFTLRTGDEFAEFDEVTGKVLFNGFEGTIEGIRAQSESTRIGVDGSWLMDPGKGLGLDLSIDASGDLVAGPLRAILPDAVDSVIDRLEIKTEGPVEIKGLKITASALGSPGSSFHIDGGGALSNGSALIGLAITDIGGELEFAVEGTKDTLGYEINLDASRLRAGLMRVHDARIQIIGDAEHPGVVLVPEINAGMHGGRIAGSAQIRPGEDGEAHYWMELHASGVRVAPVFDDLLLSPEGLSGPPRPGKSMVLSAWNRGEDLSRGAMTGDLTLTGPTNDPTKRSGRGSARVSGGTVVELPGFINLIEASNLSLPSGSPLDSGEAEFYIDGQAMAFERLSIASKRVEILGYGTMDWGTRAVDLRFRSRSLNPIPILSGLIENLRDELITTRASGILGHTKYSVSQFSSTKRLINALLSKPETLQQQRLHDVEQQVQQSRIRTKQRVEEKVVYPSGTTGPIWDWIDQNAQRGPDDPKSRFEPIAKQGSGRDI